MLVVPGPGGDPSFSVGADVNIGGNDFIAGNNEFDALNAAAGGLPGNYPQYGNFTVTPTGWSWSAPSYTTIQQGGGAGQQTGPPSNSNVTVKFNIPSYDASQPALAGPSITANTPLSTAGYAKSVAACVKQAEAEVKASNGAISFTDAFNACMTGS